MHEIVSSDLHIGHPECGTCRGGRKHRPELAPLASAQRKRSEEKCCCHVYSPIKSPSFHSHAILVLIRVRNGRMKPLFDRGMWKSNKEGVSQVVGWVVEGSNFQFNHPSIHSAVVAQVEVRNGQGKVNLGTRLL